MPGIDPRWRVQLEGRAEDIDLLEHLVSNSIRKADDYLVSRMNGVVVLEPLELVPAGIEAPPPRERVPQSNVPILTSTRWDSIDKPEDVVTEATSVLKVLSGCLQLLTVSAPITLGTVYEILADGRINATRDTTIPLLIRPPKEEYPTPAQFRRVVELTDHTDILGDLLAMYADDPDWFAIYKMIEGIENHLGGERAMRDCPFLKGAELKRAKQTANAVRHLDNSLHRAPADPMSLDDARRVMRESIISLVEEVGKTV